MTWEIEQVGDSCRLTVVHDRLPDSANAELYGGWPMILSGLKTLLETGGLLTTPGSLMYAERLSLTEVAPHHDPRQPTGLRVGAADHLEAGPLEHRAGADEGHREVDPALARVDGVGLDGRRPLRGGPGDGALEQRGS